jgi:hypothetical protein
MAKLYVTEYTAPVANSISLAEPNNVDQTPVAIGSSSTQSSAFAGDTSMVRLHTDSICSIAFGTNPTATANNKRMAANATEYFAVPEGQSYKVAVITNT